MTEEYRKGYEQGVKDLAEKLQKFYDNYRGSTYSAVVAYHVGQIKKDLLNENKDNE